MKPAYPVVPHVQLPIHAILCLKISFDVCVLPQGGHPIIRASAYCLQKQ